MRQKAIDGFYRAFGDENGAPRVFFAPGRVNLIGEHIDYNGGLVLPCALDLGTYAAVRRREDGVIRLASANFEPFVSLTTDALAFNAKHLWANYPKGVTFSFGELGIKFPGFEMYIFGDLPNGAGLSSSASVSMAAAIALDGLFGLEIDKIELVKLCRRTEFYNGVNCGVMDPFASAMGREDNAVLLDCATLEYSYVPLALGDYRIVITNTNKRRGLVDSKYNERRAECENALADLKAKGVKIEALCGLTPDEFERNKQAISDGTARKRAEHAVYENARTKKAVELLEKSSWLELMALMIRSHISLRDLYEVSCRELDTLFDAALIHHDNPETPPLYAARMTGAGFGGCTVNIVHKDFLNNFTEFVGGYYQTKTGISASFCTAKAGEGAREIYEHK